jgi:hypothetical protein
VKETLKPLAYEQSEDGLPPPPPLKRWGGAGQCLLACLLKNEPASHSPWRGEVLCGTVPERERV